MLGYRPHPSLAGGGSSGPPYDDTALKNRVADVESEVAEKADLTALAATDNAVFDLTGDVAVISSDLADKADLVDLAATDNAVHDLKIQSDADHTKLAAQQLREAAGYVSELVFLGTHAISAGTTFNRAALLAEAFLAGKDPNRIRCDLVLVGGGSSGIVKSAASASLTASLVSPGGRPGSMRVVKNLRLSALNNGVSIAVGAGGARSSSTTPNDGGTTRFGSYKARGGLGFRSLDGDTYDGDLSDVLLGRPGGLTSWNGLISSASTQAHVAGHPSLGPGAGGGASGTVAGNGGSSGYGSDITEASGGLAFASSGSAGTAGSSAGATTFSFGSGGAGARGADAGNGGFPGGGGGSVTYDSSLTPIPQAGAGGDGVIRILVYELRSA